MESVSEDRIPKIQINRESSEELFKTLLVSIYNESPPKRKNRNEEFYSQVCIPSPSLSSDNLRRSMSAVSTHSTNSDIVSALAHSNPIKQSRNYTPQSNIPLSASLNRLNCPIHLKPIRNSDTPDSNLIGYISNRSDDSHSPLSQSDIEISTPSRLTEFNDSTAPVKSTSMVWSEDDVYRKELNDRSRERDRLQNELKSKEERISSLRRQMEDCEERSSVDSEQLRQLKEKVRRLERDCEVGRKEKDGVEEGQQWLQSQLDQMMKERIKLQQELATSRGLVLSKGSELENTKADLTKASRECSHLRTHSLKERAQIVTTLERVEEEVLSKDSLLEELNSQLYQVSEERDNLINKMSELKQNFTEHETMKNELENQLRFQQEQLTETKHRLEESERKKQELKREISQMNMQVETNQNQLANIQKNHDGLHVQKTAAERLLMDKENMLGGLSQEKQLLEQQLQECRQQISYLNTQIGAIQGELAEKKRKITEMELEEEARVRAVQRAIQERDFAHVELQDVKQEFNDLLKEKESNEKKLQKELEAKEKKVKNVQYAMRDVGDKMKAMEDGLNEKSEREESMITELDTTKRENQQGKLRINQLQAELAHIQIELANSQEESRRAKEMRGEGVQFLQEERGKLMLQLNQAKMDYDRNLSTLKQEVRQGERDRESVMQQLIAEQQKTREKLYRSEEGLRRAQEQNVQLEQEVRDKSSRTGIEKARSFEKLEKRYEILQQQNDDLVRQFEERKKELDTVHSQLNNEHDQKNHLLREFDKVKRDYNKKGGELEQALSQRGYEFETMKGQLNATQQGYAQLSEHAQLLERALADKEGMLARLSAQAEMVLSQKQAEDNEMQEILTDLTSRAHQYEKERDAAYHEATLMKERVNRMQADLRASYNDQTSLLDRKDSQELKVANLEGKHRASEKNLKELESRYENSETEKTRLQAQVKQFDGQLSMRIEQANFLQDRLNMAQSQTAELEAHSQKLEEMLSSSEKRHQSEIQSLREMYSTLQETTQTKHDHVLQKVSTSLPSTGPSKNVAALQTCLISLKEDMGKLQSQMYQQVENVNTSFALSKKFENHFTKNIPGATPQPTYPQTSTPRLMKNQDYTDY
ncbi:Golgin subfamily A member 3 [Oopsacas minuta]|uniref:Golgin subfamily A member 3 n=1 Tax=Oopsacas minuta TaxID=111878 RepID=A0AAV7KJ05_9METZ|nr:Golgin subfamily A member 3 [Oopsacas minuta]